MFKKFDEKEDVTGMTQMKTSLQKNIKSKLVALYPYLEDYMTSILPKKDTMRLIKCHDHVEILAGPNGDLLFVRHRDGPFMPTLKLLHKYPFILPRVQVDKGAIRFVLSGANIMCPGLTSPGGRVIPLPKQSVVSVHAEGKEHAICVGLMKLSTEEIKKVNKGVGIENIHFLNDGLWHMKSVK